MILSVPWEWGKILYIKTDSEQKPRQLVAVLHLPGNRTTFQLSCGTGNSWHYDFEISEEVNTLAKMIT